MAAKIDLNKLVKQGLSKRTDDDIKDMDKGGGGFAKIEQSGMHELTVVMAKQVQSQSSAAANFKIEFANADGAKVFWESGWYLNKEGSPLTAEGELSIGAQKLIGMMYILTGEEALPELSTATIKEQEWNDGKPTDVSVEREICKDIIDKFCWGQILRIKTNKIKKTEVDGEWTEEILNEARQYNETRRVFNIDSKLTYSESLMDAEGAEFEKAEEYCDNNPVVDRFKPQPGSPSAPAGQSRAGSATGAPAAAATAGRRSFSPRG